MKLLMESQLGEKIFLGERFNILVLALDSAECRNSQQPDDLDSDLEPVLASG